MALPIPMAVKAIFIPTTPKHKNSEVTIWCGNYQYIPQIATWLLWVWNLIMVDWKQMEGEKVEMATLSRRNQWWSSGEGKIFGWSFEENASGTWVLFTCSISDFTCSRAGQFLANLDSTCTYKAPFQAHTFLPSASRSLLTPWRFSRLLYEHSPEIRGN